MAQVQGDATGVHALGCTMGDHASDASAQASDFAQASSLLPTGSFSGLAGDNMRSYLSQMHRAATKLAEAYQAVARFLPKVAEAIRQAQQDERSMQEAQQALSTAQQRLGQAEIALEAAQASVDAANSNPFGPGLGGPGLGLPGAAPTGPTPAQLAALAHAKQELAQAQKQVQEATHRFQAAQRRFRQADDQRRSVLAAFSALCQKESEVASMAIPQPPSPFLSPFAPLVDPVRSLQLELQADVVGLRDLPVLVATGFVVRHYSQVLGAVRTMNVSNLDLWTASSVQQYTQAHQPKPAPAAHHSLFSLHTLEHVGSSVLNAGGSGLNWLADHTVQDLGYAGDAALGGLTGTWFALTHPAADVKTMEWAVGNPLQFASKAINLQGLKENPEKWASQLIPVVATVAVTKGLGSAEVGTAETAGDASSRASGLLEAARAQPNVGQKLKLLDAAHGQTTEAEKLIGRSVGVGRGKSWFEYGDGLQTRAAVATTCQSPDGGWARDQAVGKATEKASERVLR